VLGVDQEGHAADLGRGQEATPAGGEEELAAQAVALRREGDGG
jgi:hypothetical protein